jgi:uncharacterized protein DUF3309
MLIGSAGMLHGVFRDATPGLLAWPFPCDIGRRRTRPLAALLSAPGCAVERGVEMVTILVVILVLMLIGAVPTWPHSRDWGYAPSGTLGLVLVILLLLALTGRL